MRAHRRLLALFLLLPLLLGGCGPLDEQRREIKQLRVMEALGVDAAPGGLRLSLSGPPLGQERQAFVASCTGASLTDALERLGRRQAAEQLFCGHMQQLLLGEEAARRGMEGLLTAVCRSSDLRPDLPLYLILGGSAEEAMAAVAQGDKGAADVLRDLAAPEGRSRLSSARGILLDLEDQGCALIRALRLQENAADGDPGADASAEGSGASTGAGDAEDPEGGSSRPGDTDGTDASPHAALIPDGFGILIGDRLVSQIPPEEAAAAELLLGELRPSLLVLRSSDGSTATLELEEGSVSLEPGRDGDGALVSLALRVRVRAVLLELDSFRPLSEDRTLAQLEAELGRQIGSLLQRSRELEADFLGLGRLLRQQAPLRTRERDLGPLLPGLELQVSVQGELSHSQDLRQEDSHGST